MANDRIGAYAHVRKRRHSRRARPHHSVVTLLHELLSWACATPRVDKVELQVRASNTRAIALYRGLGFVEEGRETRLLELGPGIYVDDVYMALCVGPSTISAPSGATM